jgi:NADH-quinone oxidoreductase subunit K
MEYMVPGNLILAVTIFTIGAIGILWRRDAITIFMCVELMFNAANLGFITIAQSLGKPEGVAVFLFVITIAAAEAAVGLALFIKIFDDRANIVAEELNLLKR